MNVEERAGRRRCRGQEGENIEDRKENESKGGGRKCCKKTVSSFPMVLQ